MNAETRPPVPVTPEDLLAYAEGSLTGESHRRVQAAVCADRSLFHQLRELRPDIWRRAELPDLPDLADIAAALEPSATHAAGWHDAWHRFQSWCAEFRADSVAAVELVGSTVRSLTETAWAPVPTAPRLRATPAGAESAGATSVHLRQDGSSLLIRAHGTGFELSVQCSRILAGRVEAKRPTGDPARPLERFPGTQVAHLRDGEATLPVPVPTGTHRLVLEITSASGELTRWACLLHRPA